MSLAPLAILFKLEREELGVESSECNKLEDPDEDVKDIEGTF